MYCVASRAWNRLKKRKKTIPFPILNLPKKNDSDSDSQKKKKDSDYNSQKYPKKHVRF